MKNFMSSAGGGAFMRAGRGKKNKTETNTAIQRLKKQMPLWDYG